MIDARRQPASLPFLPTVLCLFGAGWVGSIAGTVVGAGPLAAAEGQAPLATTLIVNLASAVVAAVAVRYLLRRVVGCEISLRSALVAVVGGALVSTVVLFLLGSAVRGGGLAMGPQLLWFLPGVCGTLVSYQLLQHARALEPRRRTLEPYLGRGGDGAGERESPPTFEDASYDECVDAARETAIALVDTAARADPDDAPELILNGLPYVEAAMDALVQATPPAKVPARLHEELVEGVRQLHEDLVAAAREAALAPGNDYYRWRLVDSASLRRTRRALHELAELGVAVDW